MKQFLTVLVLVAIIAAGVYYYQRVRDTGPTGGPVEASYVPDTARDLIRVSFPEPGDAVTSPLTIEGEARGTWYFEATFPFVVVNWDGLIIGEGFATADGDWMTEDFVPFHGTVTFTADTTVSDRGAIIIERANASGLPEHDAAVEIPVRLR